MKSCSGGCHACPTFIWNNLILFCSFICFLQIRPHGALFKGKAPFCKTDSFRWELLSVCGISAYPIADLQTMATPVCYINMTEFPFILQKFHLQANHWLIDNTLDHGWYETHDLWAGSSPPRPFVSPLKKF